MDQDRNISDLTWFVKVFVTINVSAIDLNVDFLGSIENIMENQTSFFGRNLQESLVALMEDK